MRYYLLVPLVVLLNGCAYIEANSRMQRLDELLWGYARAMTWSDLATAASATRPALTNADAFQDIKITAYEPASLKLEDKGKTARRLVQIRYVHTTRMVEHKLTVEEQWKYSDDSKLWVLESGFPQFR